MGGRKPTLGFISRTAAVVAMRADGMSTADVANRLSIEPKTVAALEASARRSRSLAEKHCTVLFCKATLAQLEPAAQARGVSTQEVVRRIIDSVIDDGLVDAVLDDGAAR